jgi:uncharacterized membrane protein YfcA
MTPILLIVPFDATMSFFGVLLSETFPQIIILGVIIITLLIALFNITKKTRSLYIAENKESEQKLEDSSIFIDGVKLELNTEDIENAQNEKINQSKTGDIFMLKVMFIILSFFTIVIFSIFSLTRPLLNVCSPNYWIHVFSQVVVGLLIGLFMVFIVRRDNQEKISRNFLFVKGDINWSNNNFILLALISSFTGALSTFMGIGGGMIMNPILMGFLEMPPQVVVATTSITTFFSALISTINFIASEKVLWDYAIYFIIISSLGSFVGIKFSNYLNKLVKRQSIFSGTLSLIIFVSIILLTINSLSSDDLYNLEFNDICS